MKLNDYIAYTDGAYSSSRNQGGVGIIILKNNWVNKKIFNLRKIPMKYKFYYILVSLQLYKLFIFISNKVRNIK